jgi:hypothetical protein
VAEMSSKSPTGSKSPKVTPGGGDDEFARNSPKVLAAVEHLATCQQWRSGICQYEGCKEVAKILFHSETCKASTGTVKEMVLEVYKQNDPVAYKKGAGFVDKQLHSFKGREEVLLANALQKYELAPKWCALCKRGTKLQKTHSRHCLREICHVPRCNDLRGHANGKSTADRAKEENDAAVARRKANFVNMWPPFCCISLHRKSYCAQCQALTERGFALGSAHVPTDKHGKISVECMQASVCCFVFSVLLITFVILFSSDYR